MRFLDYAALSLFVLLPVAAAGAAMGDPYARLPLRKAGLWEVTLQAHAPRLGAAPQAPLTVQQCTDRNAEQVIPFFLLPAREGCSEITVAQRADRSWEVSASCTVEGHRSMRMRVMLSGDMHTVYSGSYSIAYPQSPQNNVGPVPFQGRWLGACTPGQSPGQMRLPNGVTVNPVDDARHAAEHHHP